MVRINLTGPQFGQLQKEQFRMTIGARETYPEEKLIDVAHFMFDEIMSNSGICTDLQHTVNPLRYPEHRHHASYQLFGNTWQIQRGNDFEDDSILMFSGKPCCNCDTHIKNIEYLMMLINGHSRSVVCNQCIARHRFHFCQRCTEIGYPNERNTYAPEHNLVGRFHMIPIENPYEWIKVESQLTLTKVHQGVPEAEPFDSGAETEEYISEPGETKLEKPLSLSDLSEEEEESVIDELAQDSDDDIIDLRSPPLNSSVDESRRTPLKRPQYSEWHKKINRNYPKRRKLARDDTPRSSSSIL